MAGISRATAGHDARRAAMAHNLMTIGAIGALDQAGHGRQGGGDGIQRHWRGM
jgi:hypothetical protein